VSSSPPPECTIEIANTYTVCPDGSIVLMEDAMLGDFTNGEIRVNRCRLFLQVECLSDVCTADGLTTDPGLQAHPPRHLTEHDQVALSRASRVSLVGNMAAVHETIHTRLFEQPAPTDIRPVDPTNESGPYTMTRLRRCSVRWYRHLSTKLQRRYC
jgi:hypothetical protein